MDYGFIFGSLFWWVFIFWYSFFEHVFCIDFSLNFGWILVSFLIFFDTFTTRTCNLLNHQKPLFFLWISMILLFRDTWFLMIFLIFSVTSFSIEFFRQKDAKMDPKSWLWEASLSFWVLPEFLVFSVGLRWKKYLQKHVPGAPKGSLYPPTPAALVPPPPPNLLLNLASLAKGTFSFYLR